MAGIIPLGYQTGVYDSALMGMLQDCVKLPQFLDAIFSFLARRTDFYVIMEHEKAKMGFPPGVAQEMVLSVRDFLCVHVCNAATSLLVDLPEIRDSHKKTRGRDPAREGDQTLGISRRISE